MKIIKPDVKILKHYVYGELSETDRKAVDLWLLFNTEEGVLEQINLIQLEKRRRETLLGKSFSSNLGNKLKVLYYRWLNHGKERLSGICLFSDSVYLKLAPAFSMMSIHQTGRQYTGDAVIEVQPKERHEIRVKIYEPSYYAVFVKTSEEKIMRVPGEKGRKDYNLTLHEPETYNDLEPIWLDVDDKPWEIWMVFDTRYPVQIPEEGDVGEWLTAFINNSLEQGGNIFLAKYILKVAPLEPERGL